MSKDKTLVSKFVASFKEITNENTKKSMVEKHVITHYSPILKKKNVLDIMMDGCVKQGKSGKYIDMTCSKLNFISAILILYTDLAIDKTKNDDGKEVPDICTAYDQLKESGALDMIINTIGSDIEELISVQEQILNTWHNENASTAAFISDIVEKVGMIFSAGLGKELSSIMESDDEKAELLSALIGSSINK